MSQINSLFATGLKVVNIGVKSFYEDLKQQKCQAVHVDWRPVAGGNKRLADALALLK